jgi:hypothetical protein
MRSKSFLAVTWTVATLVAVVVVWQSLSFVSTRTDDDAAADRALADAASNPVTTATTTGRPTVADTASSAVTTITGVPIESTAVPGTGSGAPAVSTTTIAGDPPTTPKPAVDGPSDAVEQTFQLDGGSTRLRFSPTGVVLVWATPNPGYQAKSEVEGSGIKVEFRNGEHRSRLDAWWDGGPQSTSEERKD